MTLVSVVGIALGVFVSLCKVVMVAENPAQVPLRRVAIRAMFGVANYLLLWTAVGCTLFLSVATVPRLAGLATTVPMWHPATPAIAFLFAAAFGMLLPEIRRGKRRILTPELGIRHPHLYRALQRTDEVTALYWQRMIFREERNLSLDLLRGMPEDFRGPIDHLWEDKLRLFAFHALEWLPPEDRQHALTLPRIRDAADKLKCMMRYYGYGRLVDILHKIKTKSVPPALEHSQGDWDVTVTDRRRGERRRGSGHVRKGHERRHNVHGRRWREDGHLEAELRVAVTTTHQSDTPSPESRAHKGSSKKAARRQHR